MAASVPLIDTSARPAEAAAHISPLSTESSDYHANGATAAAMETQFASREELLAYVSEFSLANGFAVVIHKSNVPRGQLWLRCDLGGSAREEPQSGSPPPQPPVDASADESVAAAPKRKRKRKTAQRLQSCPFQLYGRRLADGAWTLKVQNDQHTHPLASRKQDLVMHPKARRLSNGQKRLVMQLTDMGIRPAVIVERMKARFPDKPIKVQDIYNARNHIRLERLAGREPFPEARESEDSTSSEAQEGSEAPPSAGPERSLSSHLESSELQQLWASVQNIVLRWPDHIQASFVQSVQALLTTLTTENTSLHTHEGSGVEARDLNDEGRTSS